ncbi:TetR/AcrR family transcriptional regulator [Brooklawnia cerclae]|uniref:AcrR family transcriptional regulator n=1 Tax=Brooklawnia cerclae TaxID=349934 RepID=A0ABX0SE84_9ACTN|nr:TetR/AcrR family transcriptional regulator [Brooklawnia cerclae]NIH56702.1 AcrR family transcriptional regulator [Brooklawnia cerclae]
MSSRERLTEAMASLLWERGYAATSPKDVMTRAGVGQGSIYHHFAGKHELAVEAFSAVVDEAVGKADALAGDGSPVDRMERYLSKPREGTRGCRVGRMTQDPQVVADSELIEMVDGAFDAIADRWCAVIAEAVADGELPASVVPEELARTLIAVIQGGYVLARARGSQEPMDAAIRGMITLLEAVREPPRAAEPAHDHQSHQHKERS